MNQEVKQILAKYLAAEELEGLDRRARESKRSLWDQLLELKKLPEDVLADLFAQQFRIPRVRLAEELIDHGLEALPEQLARRHLCVPLRLENNRLLLCLANPANLDTIREVEFHTGYVVAPVVATRTEILAELDRSFAGRGSLADVVRNTWESQELEWFHDDGEEIDLDESESRRAAETGPVVRLVNLMIMEALRGSASDIHIEPGENEVHVRNRIDGLLRDVMVLPKWLHAGIVSRIKILSDLDISERRRSQDGHISVNFRQRRVDLRISTLPTRDGEKVVMRILGSGKGIPELETIGMQSDDLQRLLNAVEQPQGIVLVTGPTGSGKTTTLYAALARRRSPDLNITTIEDPVEFHLPGINQVQVSPKAGMTFANILRSILRQDPDVILLGEIRDKETAEVAFRAAMTGHLVLSSLHTNTALGTVYRLIDLGVESFLVSSCLNLVMAQRLVRTICPHCRETYTPAAKNLERLGWEETGHTFVRGKGCGECGRTGYSGRIGLFEVLPMTPEVQDAIGQKAPDSTLQKVAKAAGMRLLVEDAKEKIKAGLTTVEEVLRVVHLRDIVPVPCPTCKAMVQPNFAACPFCLTVLRHACAGCGAEMKKDWKICPFCHHSAEAAPEGTTPAGPQWTQ